ncbi:hypothetical protein JTE90_020947 [Oedothorax gibbosus]|uniref:Calcyclin-binding protein n=1 Tax=Oedothorax gibbosus TaxID=931172 RepID=A0AAV6VNI2_9ARAC|nr:hypothetical protein JTE90_020947 [Oedothorax gibbosus]
MAAVSNLRRDADELLRLAMLTESANVKRILTSEATKLVQLAEAEDKAKDSTQQKSPVHAARPSYRTTKLYNYGWDQSPKFLKIYVTLDGVQGFGSDCAKCQFDTKSFDLQIFDNEKKVSYVLTVNNLLKGIVPSESYTKIKTDMVIVFLKKSTSDNWECVTEAEKKAKDAKAPKFDNKEADPSASLMTLMKQMYDDGDDDMKRTIAKAWTEARDKKSPDDVMM